MQTNVAWVKGKNSTDFTVNNSMIRRKTTYISIIAAINRYSFLNGNILPDVSSVLDANERFYLD